MPSSRDHDREKKAPSSRDHDREKKAPSSRDDREKKASRRQRAAESLNDHFADNSETDGSERHTAGSWSSHDISAGTLKHNRRSSTGAGSTTSSGSRPRGEQRTGAHSSKEYKTGLSKISAEFGDSSSMISTGSGGRSRKQRPGGSSVASGIPRSPAPSSARASVSSSLMSPSGRSRAAAGSSSRRKSESAAAPPSPAGAANDKLAKILALKNQWSQAKEKHEQIAQQAITRRTDLTKEIF